MIAAAGGIDLQVLGVGGNGHIGFNEPGTPFEKTTHLVTLTEETRRANSRFFPSLEDVPRRAVTMGIKSIMNAREIILIAAGEEKAGAVSQTVRGRVTTEWPSSVLQLHPNITLVVDEAAAGLLK
jgi:glucosamine-6-phosphate deaminase